MTEPTLFEPMQIGSGPAQWRYPRSPGFKRPGTSQDAAESIKKHAHNLQAQVLHSLRECPASADQVAKKLGKSILSIRPRLSELNALGLIVETEQRVRNDSGKLASVWRAK